MKFWLLLTLIALNSALSAENCKQTTQGYLCSENFFGFDSVLMFDVGGGYRSDNLKWNVAPTTATKTFEKWENVGFGIVEANLNFLACDHYLLKADFDAGWFDEGGHQSYKTPTSNLKSPTGGRVFDLSGSLGYQFNYCCNVFSVAPLAGYAHSFQKYKNHVYTNKLQDNELQDNEETVVFHNSYIYRWAGPMVGVELAFHPCCDLMFYFDYTFHWIRAKGNIKENFTLNQPHTHIQANQSYGNEYTLGIDYIFCDGWFLSLKGNYKEYYGKKAHYKIRDTALKLDIFVPLNNLTWNSYNVTLDLGFNF